MNKIPDLNRAALLSVKDWELLKMIRLEALEAEPISFASSYDEENQLSDDHWKSLLKRNNIFAVYDNGNLIAMAGIGTNKPNKIKHTCYLFGMYVKSDFRGSGIATELLNAVTHHAMKNYNKIVCSVVTTNNTAISLYKKQSFEIYGTEPAALLVDGVYYDEHLMYKILNENTVFI